MINFRNRPAKAATIFAAGVATAMAALSSAEAGWRTDRAEHIASPVRYGDLDLTKSDDVERLVRRLEMKARKMCRETNSAIATRKMIDRCRKEIVEANRTKITAAVEEAHRGRVES